MPFDPPNEVQSVADELGHIQTEMARLKAREAALVAPLLGHTGAMPFGRDYATERRATLRRRFDPDLLPPRIRDNPKYWVTEQVVEVRARALDATSPAPRSVTARATEAAEVELPWS